MDTNTLVAIVIQVITGVIGGQAVGAALSQAAMGQLPKILGGAIGGVGGAAILGSLLGHGTVDPAAAAAAAGGLGSSLNIQNIVGGAGGGAILTGIIGAVMGAMKK
ncbi:hypothetical protein RFM41_00390 [Mesorhizobium sp. VK25A]|uniref:DNA methyltransferase n=1 Tax=Mesorhizobium vachelliae TaxID=3072309 RepID=A0ABU4ZXR3_9HYPH|nr:MULTISPECIES: hypothetical protein [unclassified Mesorhizobium]MDX8530191.1 hypothetical protein [Mesorhizobium sp. VK25D]MDX8542168.1 hypothetical protein [Mesorhizobium sp. VK25A]